MKKNILVILFFVSGIFLSHAQITLGTSDFSHANDTFRVSMATPFSGMDETLTGKGYLWDFSQLDNTRTGQDIDSFVTVSSTGVFAFLFAGSSNQASPTRDFALDTTGTLAVSGAYNFLNNSSANFRQTGTAAYVNAIPVPIIYSVADVWYKFPMDNGNVDTSNSVFAVFPILPNDFYYGGTRERINEVDGWGTLITPYGTFDVLRLKSVIHEHDTVFSDTLVNINVGFDLPEQIEYKWLGAGKGIPLLQITTRGGIVSQIVYRDSLRTTIGIEEINSLSFSFELFPNPVSENLFVKYFLTTPSDVVFEIMNEEGKIISSEKVNRQGAGENLFHLSLKNLKRTDGNYFVRMNVDGKYSSKKIVRLR